MRRIVVVLMFFSPFWQMSALAQMVRDTAGNVPRWLVSIDTIKTKAQGLMEKNIQLMSERDSLTNEDRKSKEQIHDVQIKNEILKQLLKERHGRSDQQMQVEDLTNQIKAKKDQLKRRQQELVKVQKQADDIDRKVRLKMLKISDLKLRQKAESLKANMQNILRQQASLAKNDQGLVQDKQRLQQEKNNESALEKELADLKQTKAVSMTVDAGDIQSLALNLQTLIQQKEDLQKKNNADNNPAKEVPYQQLTLKKKELEDKIKEYEVQLDRLKNPAILGLWGEQQRKQIVHQMVEIDNHNAQLRQRITDLREDVSLLKKQVSRLERKVNFTQGSLDSKK